MKKRGRERGNGGGSPSEKWSGAAGRGLNYGHTRQVYFSFNIQLHAENRGSFLECNEWCSCVGGWVGRSMCLCVCVGG